MTDDSEIIDRLFKGHEDDDDLEAVIDRASDDDRAALAEWMVGVMDGGRIAAVGGYPSQWEIRDHLFIMASVGDGDTPELTVCPVREFLAKHDYYYRDAIDDRVAEKWG